jgi:hypothetical protein
MSVNELQALTQQFAYAFDQRDLKTFLAMLSDDMEVFDHVPYRFDGKPLFAKYLNEVVAVSLSELRLQATIVPRVWRYRRCRKCSRHVYGSNERRQGPVHPRPN